MKNKKIIIPTLVAVVALAAGALYVPISRAATNMPLFGTTTLLGINLLMGNSGGANSMMTFVDFAGAATTSQNYTLPSVSGKQGQIVIMKAINGQYGEEGTFLNVYPASGQMLDNDSNKEYYQLGAWPSSAAVIFIADPTNNTWWIISQS